MINRRECIYLGLLVLIILSLPLSCAKMGYDINADASSPDGTSAWSLHRSTSNLSYSCDENVSGSGKFSRLSHLRGLAGHMKDESSYALNGSLELEDKIRFLSKEGKVIIKADAYEYEFPPDSESSQDSNSETPNIPGGSINITVDERWPSALIDFKSMKYSGPGIRTRDTYYHEGDKVSTSFYSTELAKESLYRASINRTIIQASITPKGVKEERSMNKTSTFVLNSDSLGPNVNLEFSRSKPYSESNRFGRTTPYILISEDYAGRQTISLKVGMNESAIIPLEDKFEWIPCCNWENQSHLDGYTDIRKIFDCTCFKSIK